MFLKGMKREKLFHNICIAPRRLFYNPENDIVNNYSSGHKSEPGWIFNDLKGLFMCVFFIFSWYEGSLGTFLIPETQSQLTSNLSRKSEVIRYKQFLVPMLQGVYEMLMSITSAY